MSKKPAPTLIDTLYRQSFRNEPLMNWTSNATVRAALQGARKFVLDDSMSTFLGELGTAAFATRPGYVWIEKMHTRLVEQLRVSARLPHKNVWIEYNLRKCQTRSSELLGNYFRPLDSPKIEGVLLQQHHSLETAIIMHLFSDAEQTDEHGYQIYTFPVAYSWTTNEERSPWPSVFGDFERKAGADFDYVDAQMATGIMGYSTRCVSITANTPLLTPVSRKNTDKAIDLLKEWTGCVRRIWALLATINDIPMQQVDVRQSKGFVAKGRYRHFLDHKVLTLHIPQKNYTKIARNLIAAARRRAHQVRGHWRLDWRNPGSPRCEHAWQVDQTCSMCRAHRLWIHEHQRGDASIGFVTHDYAVTHEVDNG
jgi:hypothetical protein